MSWLDGSISSGKVPKRSVPVPQVDTVQVDTPQEDAPHAKISSDELSDEESSGPGILMPTSAPQKQLPPRDRPQSERSLPFPVRKSYAYEIDEIEDVDVDKRRNFIFGLALVSLLISVVLLGYCIFFMVRNIQFFSYMSDFDAEAGFRVYGKLILCFWFVLTGVFLSIIGSIGIFGAAMVANRKYIIFFVALSFIAAAFVFGAVITLVLATTKLSNTICFEEDCNPRDGFSDGTPFNAFQAGFIDLKLGIFDECCMENIQTYSDIAYEYSPPPEHEDLLGINSSYSRVQTGPFGPCPSNGFSIFDMVCKQFMPTILTSVSNLQSLTDLLCTCAPNEVAYNKVREKMRRETDPNVPGSGCGALSDVTFYLSSTYSVPSLPVSLLGLITPTYPTFFAAHPELNAGVEIPLVGNPAPPYNNIFWPHGGFGCGFGFAKGFILANLLYYQSVLTAFSRLCFCQAGISSLAMVLISGLLYFSKSKNGLQRRPESVLE